jgi:hypothetical protein
LRGHNNATVDLVRRSISAEITRRAALTESLGFGDAYRSALFDLQGWLDGADVNELLTPPPVTLVDGYAHDARKAKGRE